MELLAGDNTLEKLNKDLCDDAQLAEYKKLYDDYHPLLLPRMLGKILIWSGNTFYGREPSYLKFRSVEVIARIPYQSWSTASYTLLTLFYTNAKKAMKLSETTKHARISLDNETMHVVVISEIMKKETDAGFFRHTFIPMIFAFFYFWATYWLYLLRPRWSYELNYLFEQHAFDQYNRFLKICGDELKTKTVPSEFLAWYGRNPKNQYEFFRSIRNDEIIHRNQSIEEIDFDRDKKHVWYLQTVTLALLVFFVAFKLYHLVPHTF